jgi:tetratricopeptide (TPR) repeat protein
MASHASASGTFVIRCPRGLDELLVPYALQVLERAQVALQDELGLVPDHRVRVEILPGAEELAQVSPLRLAEVRRTGTTGLSQDHRIMLITPRALATGYGWADTLAHEYVHYVLEVKARHRVPLWLHEGLARFLQERWRAPLPTALEPLQRHRLALGLRHGRLVPLRKMMPSFAKLKDHRQAALAYAQVGSMILQLHRAHGSAGLRRLLEGLARGLGVDAALRQVTGVDLRRFVARWETALRARRLKPVPAFNPPELHFKRGPGLRARARPRTPFERFRRLGAILRGRARYRAAAVEYRKALAAVDGADADTANTLARILLRLRQPDEAARVVARALPFGDHVAALHVVAARAAEARGQSARAEAHLWRANGIDPFDPEIHCSLSRLLTRRGDAIAPQETLACTKLKK